MKRKRSNLTSIEVATGFNVYIVKSLSDEATHDIIYLNIVGSRGACRATMAVLKSRQINNWQLCQHPVRLQKIPGHHQMITELPNGMVDYLWVSYQAIPQRLQADMPGFVWLTDNDDHDNAEPPEHFYDIFQATMNFPSRPEWAKTLWNKGLDENLIRTISTRNSNDMIGYGVYPNDPAWERIIKESFLMGTMSLVDGHKVIRTIPSSDQIKDSIKYQRFNLGDIVISPGMKKLITSKNLDIVYYFTRHAAGDWGDMEWREKHDNNQAIINGKEVKSIHKIEDSVFNIATGSDRSMTIAYIKEEVLDNA